MRPQPARHVAATAGLIIVLGAVLALLIGPTVKGLAIEWMSSPDSSYGVIMAAIAGATIWNRRRSIAAAAAQPTGLVPGALLLALGLLAFLVGRFGADVFVTRVSSVIVLAGLTWCVAGTTAARLCAAPFLFLLLAVPLPTLIVNAVTLPLQLVASRMAEWMLAAAHIPVFRDGNVLELQSTSLEVAEACSGLRSLISLTAIGCLVAWATERTVLRRLLVIASALPIALALNAVRIAATGAACEVWGPRAASGGWHTFAGWITFVVAMAVLVRGQRALPRAERASTLAVRQAASA